MPCGGKTISQSLCFHCPSMQIENGLPTCANAANDLLGSYRGSQKATILRNEAVHSAHRCQRKGGTLVVTALQLSNVNNPMNQPGIRGSFFHRLKQGYTVPIISLDGGWHGMAYSWLCHITHPVLSERMVSTILAALVSSPHSNKQTRTCSHSRA